MATSVLTQNHLLFKDSSQVDQVKLTSNAGFLHTHAHAHGAHAHTYTHTHTRSRTHDFSAARKEREDTEAQLIKMRLKALERSFGMLGLTPEAMCIRP